MPEINDREIRGYVAENCKEGVDHRAAIEDWGDHNEDHSDQSHSYAWGEEGTGKPLDLNQPENIQVK